MRGRALRLEPLERRELLATVAYHWPVLTDTDVTEIAASASAAASAVTFDLGANDSGPWATYGEYASLTGADDIDSPLRSFVGPLTAQQITDDPIYRAGKAAESFLADQQTALGLDDTASELTPLSVSTDSLGMTHLRYHRSVDGVPVFGSQVNVHLAADGSVTSAGGRVVTDIDLDTTPQLSDEQAVALARDLFDQQYGLNAYRDCDCQPTTEAELLSTRLYVYNNGVVENYDEPASHLVWEVKLATHVPQADEAYYIDAHTGALVKQLSGTSELYREIYDCSFSAKHPGCELNWTAYGYTYGRAEGAPPRGPNPNSHDGFEYFYGTTDTDDIYDMAKVIHQHYVDTFERDGANGRGGVGNGARNYTLTRIYTYVEVYPGWEPGGAAYTTDGSLAFTAGSASPDVFGHEYAHGVSNSLIINPDDSADGLVYAGESGALSENFSDVMGEDFELFVTGSHDYTLALTSAAWDAGESYPLRNMSDPPSLTSDGRPTPYPDRYRDPNYYFGTEDNEGVHWNSTVPSKAFCLAAEGGTFNGYEIEGIGFDKAVQVWFRAVTEYYTTTETFNDAYHSITQAALDLYGPADALQVQNALRAVEMHLPGLDSGSDPIVVENVTVTEDPEIETQFAQAMDVTTMLAAPSGDGSIVDAVTLVNVETGPLTLTADQFTYDEATNTLTWTGDAALTAGIYEWQLDGSLLTDTSAEPLRGGASGLAYHLGQFDAVTTIQAGTGDLAVESYSAPTLADLDGDELLDLIVGEKTAGDEGKIRIYPNTGTAETPVYGTFTYAQTASGDLTVSGNGCLGIAPVATDWNGDGLLDLVAGLADGRVQFVENTGTNAAPVFASPVDVEIAIPASLAEAIDVGDRAMPAVADWNGDGRKDLIVGAMDGKIRVYLDTATSGEPYFQTELILQDPDGDLVVPTGRSAPALIDLDGDGRRDLVVGNTEGQLLLYTNVGADVDPQFDTWQLLQADGTVIDLDATPRSRPWVGHYNADGLDDLVFGAEDGLVRVALAASGPTQTSGLDEVGEPGELYVHIFQVASSPIDEIDATEGDDTIAIVVTPTDYVVTINGEEQTFSKASVSELHINGLGGADTIAVTATGEDETAALEPDQITLTGQTYLVEATGVEIIAIDAGEGDDTATMLGADGSNRFYSYADRASLANSTGSFSYRVEGFETVEVDVSAGTRDYAFLYGSTGEDQLVADGDQAVLTRDVTTDEPQATTAAGFERVYSYGTVGDGDTAQLIGSNAARNRFYSYPDHAILTESQRSFYFYARGYGMVTAESTSDETGYAYMYDSSGTDAFAATPDSAEMDRADGYGNATATGFTRIYAYATRGGLDTATLTGATAGGNRYRGYPMYSTLTDTAGTFHHYARGFTSLTAVGSQDDTSGDRAYLYDSSGDDQFAAAFEGSGVYHGGVLTDEIGPTPGTYANWFEYFDLVYARSSDSGTNDTIDVNEEALAYRLIQMGTW